MKVLIYILSISFQVSGALLLLKYSLSTRREQVNKRFVDKNIITKDGEKINYSEEGLRETFRTAYLNKISFGFIALGYLINIFGDLEGAFLPHVFIVIIFLTALLMTIAYFIVFLKIKYSKKINKPLTEDELLEYGIEPNFSAITEEDIDNIFNDC